jgi:hypothetical protein
MSDNDNQPKIARVVPWGSGEWGVAIDLPSGKRTAYAVASRNVAEGECHIINGGNAPAFGPWAGMNLIGKH